MIIDCHTHCYPSEVSEAPRAWAERHNETHWADLVAPLGRKTIQDWASPSTMLQHMDDAGVDKAILLGWYWENEDTCRWHNEVISEWCRHAPDRFIGFASIYPNDRVVDQLEMAQELGLIGVGEMHPGVQKFNSQSRAWRSLASWCTENKWPINFHTTRPKGDHPSAIQTPLDDYIKMARDYPELNFIFAHWGGGLPEMTKDKPLPNAYFDCSASPLMYDMNVFEQVVKHTGTGKVLFGSDYPLRIFPRKFKRAEMVHYIEKIEAESMLSAEQRKAILSSNLLSLIQLPSTRH